jgi:DNA-binding transcriptional LysR family regulator
MWPRSGSCSSTWRSSPARGDWPGCETEQPLVGEVCSPCCRRSTALRTKQSLYWHDLAGESFIVSDAAPGPEIHDYLIQRLAGLGHHPNIRPQYVGRDVLLSMVAVGRGLTVVSEAATGAQFPGAAYRLIEDEILPFSAIWSPRNDNPACRRFLSLARSLARSERPAIRRTLSAAHLPASPSQILDLSQ